MYLKILLRPPKLDYTWRYPMTAQQPQREPFEKNVMIILDYAMFQTLLATLKSLGSPDVARHIETCSSPHTPAPDDEMADRFTTKYEAWSQGFQDGKTAAMVDLNIIETDAARTATLAAYQRVYDELVSSDLIRGDCMRDAIRVLEPLRRTAQEE